MADDDTLDEECLRCRRLDLLLGAPDGTEKFCDRCVTPEDERRYIACALKVNRADPAAVSIYEQRLVEIGETDADMETWLSPGSGSSE